MIYIIEQNMKDTWVALQDKNRVIEFESEGEAKELLETNFNFLTDNLPEISFDKNDYRVARYELKHLGK